MVGKSNDSHPTALNEYEMLTFSSLTTKAVSSKGRTSKKIYNQSSLYRARTSNQSAEVIAFNTQTNKKKLYTKYLVKSARIGHAPPKLKAS